MDSTHFLLQIIQITLFGQRLLFSKYVQAALDNVFSWHHGSDAPSMTVGDVETLTEQDVDEEDENKAQKTDADIVQQDIIQVQDLYKIHTKN